MTIQKQQPTPQSHSNMEEALSGNPAAGELAQKAAALMEQLLGPAVTPKLSELPTKADRLNAVADAIERQELVKRGIGFNMGSWCDSAGANRLKAKAGEKQTYCGTVACIAGWTDALDRSGDYPDDESFRHKMMSTNVGISYRAGRILGLTSTEMSTLFVPWSHPAVLSYDFSPERAIAVLRHFAKTNEVRWDLFDVNGARR